jgi:hypothetical protein
VHSGIALVDDHDRQHAIVQPPKSGRLVIQGPSFRYFADADGTGSNSFKIAISGTSLHLNGTSSIEVDITSQ